MKKLTFKKETETKQKNGNQLNLHSLLQHFKKKLWVRLFCSLEPSAIRHHKSSFGVN